MILQKFYIQALKLFNSKKVFFYNPKYSKWIFLLLLILVSLFYQYHKILFLRPQGVHQWRQADCLSFTMNYYQEGMDFFSPKVHNSGSDGTGKTASDFPIIYYFVAFLWTVFGYHEFIFRIVNLIITFLGLFALFKITEDLLKDSVWSIMLVLLLFTSPMLAYYSNNFLANVPAFSFVLIGWYFFLQFYKKRKIKFLYTTMFFFMLGGLLKITSAMSFVAISVIFIMELFNIYKFKNNCKIFNNPSRQFIPFIIVIVGILSWVIFARAYNNDYNKGFFLLSILPIWNLSWENIKSILDHIDKIWIYEYFNVYVQYFAIILFICILIFFKKVNKFLLTVTLLFFLAFVLFLILWFKVFEQHDYYLINLLIFFVFICLTFFYYLRQNHNTFFNSLILKLVFLIFLINNIGYCEEHIRGRFSGWMNVTHLQYFQPLETITPYLRSLGIERTDKVICFPDKSINTPLYLMDQKGWTGYGDINLNRGEKIAKRIKSGAVYLIILDSTICKEDNIQPYIKNKIGSYKNVDIYDLRNL